MLLSSDMKIVEPKINGPFCTWPEMRYICFEYTATAGLGEGGRGDGGDGDNGRGGGGYGGEMPAGGGVFGGGGLGLE